MFFKTAEEKRRYLEYYKALEKSYETRDRDMPYVKYPVYSLYEDNIRWRPEQVAVTSYNGFENRPMYDKNRFYNGYKKYNPFASDVIREGRKYLEPPMDGALPEFARPRGVGLSVGNSSPSIGGGGLYPQPPVTQQPIGGGNNLLNAFAPQSVGAVGQGAVDNGLGNIQPPRDYGHLQPVPAPPVDTQPVTPLNKRLMQDRRSKYGFNSNPIYGRMGSGISNLFKGFVSNRRRKWGQ